MSIFEEYDAFINKNHNYNWHCKCEYICHVECADKVGPAKSAHLRSVISTILPSYKSFSTAV